MFTGKAFRFVLSVVACVLFLMPSGSQVAAQDAQTIDLWVYANADPGDGTLLAWEGAVLIATDAAGTEVGRCTTTVQTAQSGGCQVTIPAGEVTYMYPDPASAPAGYVVDEEANLRAFTAPYPGYADFNVQPFVANIAVDNAAPTGRVEVWATEHHMDVQTEAQMPWIGTTFSMVDANGNVIDECVTDTVVQDFFASCWLEGPVGETVTITNPDAWAMPGQPAEHTHTIREGDNVPPDAPGAYIFARWIDMVGPEYGRVTVNTIACDGVDQATVECETWDNVNIVMTLDSGYNEFYCGTLAQAPGDPATCAGKVSTTDGVTLTVQAESIPAGYQVVADNNYFAPGWTPGTDPQAYAVTTFRLIPADAVVPPTVVPTAAQGVAPGTTPAPSSAVTTLPSTGSTGEQNTQMLIVAAAAGTLMLAGAAVITRRATN